MALSEELVSIWLATYMFKGDSDADQHAKEVAQKLNNHATWRSHARRIDMTWLTGPEAKLNVIDLASDPKLDEAVRALDLAIKITFAASSAFKIVENSKGDALIGHATPPINISFTPAPEAPRTATPTEPISSLPKASVAGRKKRKKAAVGSHR